MTVPMSSVSGAWVQASAISTRDWGRFGVGEYWLVDPMGKSVELYLLEDGAYVLHNVCTVHPDWMLESMKPEERAAVETTFRCHLYEEFELSLDDIFSASA